MGHRLLQATLVRLGRALYLDTTAEPSHLKAPDSNIRADVLFQQGADQILTDCTTVNSLCQTHLPQARIRPGAALKKQDKAKDKKYEPVVRNYPGLQFISCATDILGGLGTQGQKLLKQLHVLGINAAGHVVDGSDIDKIITDGRQEMAVAIQQGNYLMFQRYAAHHNKLVPK